MHSRVSAGQKCTGTQPNSRKIITSMNNSKWLWEWLQMDCKLLGVRLIAPCFNFKGTDIIKEIRFKEQGKSNFLNISIKNIVITPTLLILKIVKVWANKTNLYSRIIKETVLLKMGFLTQKCKIKGSSKYLNYLELILMDDRTIVS
jgi:hypothetical protein